MYTYDLDEIKLFLAAIYSKPLPSRGASLVVSFGIKNVKLINTVFYQILFILNIFNTIKEKRASLESKL